MQSLFSRVCPVAEVGPEDELAEPGLAKARELAEVRWASQSRVSVLVQVRPDMKPGEPALDEATAKSQREFCRQPWNFRLSCEAERAPSLDDFAKWKALPCLDQVGFSFGLRIAVPL